MQMMNRVGRFTVFAAEIRRSSIWELGKDSWRPTFCTNGMDQLLCSACCVWLMQMSANLTVILCADLSVYLSVSSGNGVFGEERWSNVIQPVILEPDLLRRVNQINCSRDTAASYGQGYAAMPKPISVKHSCIGDSGGSSLIMPMILAMTCNRSKRRVGYVLGTREEARVDRIPMPQVKSCTLLVTHHAVVDFHRGVPVALPARVLRVPRQQRRQDRDEGPHGLLAADPLRVQKRQRTLLVKEGPW